MQTSQFDVLRDLLPQRTDRLEPDFFAEAAFKGQIDLHSVEIPRKIDHMGLGHENLIIPKCRSESHIRHDRKEPTRRFGVLSETPQMAKIDAGCRQDLGFGRKVGRRKSERPPAPIPLDHLPTNTEGPPE